VGSVNQLRFSDSRGEVSFFGQKMIILRRDVFRVMREGLERLVGDQAAPFLSYLASGIGVHEGSIFRESVQSAGDQERAGLENLIHAAFEDTNLGWGKTQVGKVNFDEGTTNVVITNCFEALENGPSESPNCMFTAGFLAGLFAEVFDKTLQANEVRCISKGDPECEFQISPTEKNPPTEPSAPEVAKTAAAETPRASPDKASTEAKAVETKTVKQEAESKPLAGASSPSRQAEAETVKNAGRSQQNFDSSVERASRIARRKQHFWERMFKKD
jgi:predicted hydrocarbon binding protein